MSKSKLNLNIDSELKKTIKHLAIELDTTSSSIVEEYIKAIKKNKDVIKAINDINNK